jgi:hypothetical protein
LTISSVEPNNDAESATNTPSNASTSTEVATGGDKKGRDQRTPKEGHNNSSKKERNTPRDRGDNKKGDARKGDARKGGSNSSTPKGAQERRTPTGAGGGGDKDKSKRTKAVAEKDTSEEAAHARFLAANEKLQNKPVKAASTQPKKVNAFSALMFDDDSDSS